MGHKIVKKSRLFFPIMLIFILAYILSGQGNYRPVNQKSSSQKNKGKVAEYPTVQKRSIPKSQKSKKQTKNQYVPGEMIVMLTPEASQKVGRDINPQNTGIVSLDKLNQQYNVSSMTSLFPERKSRTSYIYRLNFPEKNNPDLLAKTYLFDNNIQWAEPNLLAKASLTEPDDPKYADGTQWALNQVGDHDIDAPEGWDYSTGSSNVSIAVIDSGVDTDHEDLVNNIWSNSGEVGGGKESNGIDDDGNGYVDDYQGWDWVTSYNNGAADNDPNPEPDGINNDGWYGIDDGVAHGTHVAGIAAGEGNNSTGIAGVCWSCKIMPLRVLDDEGWGDYVSIAQAIYYAIDNGANVINMSLGGGFSHLLSEVIIEAYSGNVVIVASAGNDGADVSHDLYSPLCNDNGQNMVIGVAATNNSDVKAGYSNYGKYYTDISAPGSAIYSTLYTNDPAHNFTENYGYMSGTSMAAPYISGLAALIKSANPTWTNKMVRDRLIVLNNNISALNPNYTGLIGAGRANVEKALDPANGFYPEGTVFRVPGNATYYMVINGQRRAFPNRYFLYLYRRQGKAIIVNDISMFPRGPDLRFPDGTIFGNMNNGRIYLVEYGKIRWIKRRSVFLGLGYKNSGIRWVRHEHHYYLSGPQINSIASAHANGTIIVQQGGSEYYSIDKNSKCHIALLGFIKYYREPLAKSVAVTVDEFNWYSNGGDLRYPSGYIVGDSGTGNIYLIERNLRRAFSSVDHFHNLGFYDSQVIWSATEAGEYNDGEAMPSTITAH